MPISESFQERLYPRLPEIIEHFGTPFHIYDEHGIRETGQLLVEVFTSQRIAFKEFFAVKALPNPRILSIMKDLGFGFDCSSPNELRLCKGIGVTGGQMMFTSTNTTCSELEDAFSAGCLINLDSVSLLDKLPAVPETLCFRYNPGPRRKQGAFSFIGNPAESKFGISYQHVVEAYQRAVELGVKHFGIHTMHTNNTLDHRDKVESARLLLSAVEEVVAQVGITFDFINLGGGLGIPYHPDDQPLDIQALVAELALQLTHFEQHQGHKPAIYLESGRYMTGPHGVLVTTVTSIKSTYRTFVGVDASMSALMRPGMYGAYHHITVPGKEELSEYTPIDVVGSLCENTDKFAIQRLLPELDEGDIIIIHDTGAHGHAMGFTYNGRLRPKELLIRNDGAIELIRRSETFEDYTATLSFPPDVLPA